MSTNQNFQKFFKTGDLFERGNMDSTIHTALFCKYSWVPTRTPLIVPSTCTPFGVSNFTTPSIDNSQCYQTVFRTDLEDHHELGRLEDISCPS